MPRGIGAVEPGEIEDTQIHSGQRHIAGFACAQAIHSHGGWQGATRAAHVGRVNADAELFGTGVNLGIGQPQGTRGVLTCGHIHRADHLSGDICTSAPLICHAERDQVFTCCDFDRLAFNHTIGHDSDQRRTIVARHDAQVGHIAAGIVGLVQ